MCWGVWGCICVAWCQGEVQYSLGCGRMVSWDMEDSGGQTCPTHALGRDPECELVPELQGRFIFWVTCWFITNECFGHWVIQIIMCCIFAYYWKLSEFVFGLTVCSVVQKKEIFSSSISPSSSWADPRQRCGHSTCSCNSLNYRKVSHRIIISIQYFAWNSSSVLHVNFILLIPGYDISLKLCVLPWLHPL